ncbi:hypothetical protein [Pseudomonas sp. AA-38]|uniref:hypothetical protein n=1 Tax=Pseudomonas sp. AA-38 TaxID=3028807 RepID=UPI0023F75AEC|nr:hypothetical protein [Pseudomonas sp. AA-38]
MGVFDKWLLKAKFAVFVMFSYVGIVNAAFECASDINAVLIYSNGVVNVLHSGAGKYTHICNLNEERQGVSVTTCAMWAGMLLNLKSENKKADFYYNTAQDYNSCSELPSYGGAPAPVYIGPMSR